MSETLDQSQVTIRSLFVCVWKFKMRRNISLNTIKFLNLLTHQVVEKLVACNLFMKYNIFFSTFVITLMMCWYLSLSSCYSNFTEILLHFFTLKFNLHLLIYNYWKCRCFSIFGWSHCCYCKKHWKYFYKRGEKCSNSRYLWIVIDSLAIA